MNSKKRLISITILAITLITIILSVYPAYAITRNPQPDGDAHPYVCLVVADVFIPGTGNVPAWRGTGALISPTVVLTAGHVTDGAAACRVWFDEVVEGNPDYPWGGPSAVEGTPYTHPDFNIAGGGLPKWITHDVGIVVLDEPVIMDEYAQLPTGGLVDMQKVMTDVDLVGYGVQTWNTGGGQPFWSGLRNRFNASAKLIASNHALSDEFVRVTANRGQGKGGTSFGDSGGPVLLSGTNITLAVNSFVTNYPSGGITYACRVDTADVLSWINGFLGP